MFTNREEAGPIASGVRQIGRVPAVAEFAGEPEHAGSPSAHPDFWKTPRAGREVQTGPVERKQVAIQIDRPGGVQTFPDHRQRLLQPLHRPLLSQAVRNGVGRLARADAEDGTGRHEMRQRQRSLGDHDRMAAHGLGYTDSDANIACLPRQESEQRLVFEVLVWRGGHSGPLHPVRLRSKVDQVIPNRERSQSRRPCHRQALQHRAHGWLRREGQSEKDPLLAVVLSHQGPGPSLMIRPNPTAPNAIHWARRVGRIHRRSWPVTQ